MLQRNGERIRTHLVLVFVNGVEELEHDVVHVWHFFGVAFEENAGLVNLSTNKTNKKTMRQRGNANAGKKHTPKKQRMA